MPRINGATGNLASPMPLCASIAAVFTRLNPPPRRPKDPTRSRRVPLLCPREETGASGAEAGNPLRADSRRDREEIGGDNEGACRAEGRTPRGKANMTQDLPEWTRFPCACPHCKTAAGFPFRVRTDQTDAERVHVELRCRHCHREWHVDRAVPALPTRDLKAAHVGR